MTKFCRYDLRTTDAMAARAFYTAILGHDRAPIWPLHEQALARGARPHWLGRIGVEDVEDVAAALVARGAMQFGPIGPTADGGRAAILRDPGGAIVAVGTPPSTDTMGATTGVEVVYHVLNTNDVGRAAVNYHDLFGWDVSERVEQGGGVAIRQFAWHLGDARVGAFADIAGRPEVHPQWLFFFEVDALDAAVATLRARGGLALDPVVTPNGKRVCVCDDPQGAAFALRER